MLISNIEAFYLGASSSAVDGLVNDFLVAPQTRESIIEGLGALGRVKTGKHPSEIINIHQ